MAKILILVLCSLPLLGQTRTGDDPVGFVQTTVSSKSLWTRFLTMVAIEKTTPKDELLKFYCDLLDEGVKNQPDFVHDYGLIVIRAIERNGSSPSVESFFREFRVRLNPRADRALALVAIEASRAIDDSMWICTFYKDTDDSLFKAEIFTDVCDELWKEKQYKAIIEGYKVADPIALYKRTNTLSAKSSGRLAESAGVQAIRRRSLIKHLAWYCEALAAEKETQQAVILAREYLKNDDSDDAITVLRETAMRSNNQAYLDSLPTRH